MGDSSNSLSSASARIQDLDYLHASNTNVSNFVSVKLSGSRNYRLWKAQMVCLLDSNNMRGIVDGSFVLPRDYGSETMKQYESLVKGWIFGSISEDVLADVYNLHLAKDVWEELRCAYGPSETDMSLHKDSTSKHSETIKETEDIEADTDKIEEEGNSIDIKAPADPEIIDVSRLMALGVLQRLRTETAKGNWSKAESILKENKHYAETAFSKDDNTILHLAVGIGRNDFVKNLFLYISDEQLLKQRSTDGSTALHIAAMVGNKQAAELLLKKNSNLFRIKDHNDKTALDKAYENMHLDTIGYLLKFSEYSLADSVDHPDEETGVRLLVNAISAKQYSIALELVKIFPNFALAREDALVAMAKTFPSGLDDWETLIYPSSLEVVSKMLRVAFRSFVSVFSWPAVELSKVIFNKQRYDYTDYIMLIPTVLLSSLLSAFMFICLFLLIICWIFLPPYYICWKGAKILAFPPIKHIENKKKEWDEAKKLLDMICGLLESSDTYRPSTFTRPILEAACHNTYEVVDCLLYISPEAIQSTDENGYDVIQLAIINRSEKIYNLIYDIGERKNVYRTCKDSFENNILHLAGKLAPSSVLNRRTGAALQLQRELQWLQEVEKFVFPSFITEENIAKETPYMVFTREHEHLVKEGEQWMKTTAESCSITAALIITIVFAAAITVPGGNQENGTPLLKNQAAFIIFAIADAISLFASSTSLLVFLSILTTRFAEKDFLVSLPRRLFIGLFTLLLSTTTMMVAFSATLFLVFCDKKLWMLAPICGLAFIPIAFFVTFQFPLMVDLFKSTYLPIFGKQRQNLLSISIDTIIKKLDWR